MISDALRAPTRSEDAIGTLIVGSILLLTSVVFPIIWVFAMLQSPMWVILGPFAVFPPLVALGYDVRVLEAGARKEETTPSFVNWSGLVRDGLLSLVVRAAYLLPLAVVVAVGGALAFGAESGALGVTGGTADLVAAGVTILVVLFALVYFAAYLYLRPAALAVFAVTGRVRSALSIQRTLDIALSNDYAVDWTLAGTVLFVGLLIATPLQLLLVGFALAFYIRTAAYVAYGRGTAEGLASLGLVGEEEPTTERAIPVGRPAPASVQAGRSVRSGEDTAGNKSSRDQQGDTSEASGARNGDRGFDFDQGPRTDSGDDRNGTDD